MTLPKILKHCRNARSRRRSLTEHRRLRRRTLFRYKGGRPISVNAAFTVLRDSGIRGQMMATRHHIRAMNRTADAAFSGAALILGGLLLLIAP